MSISKGTCTQAELQAHLDSMPVGATWQPAQAEYAGPIIISKPLVVDGRGATFWAVTGPVISVRSEGVAFRDVRIEVTGNHPAGNPEARHALAVETGLRVDLERVEVKGTVIGLLGEEGDWAYPSSLRLGTLAGVPGSDFIARLGVPVPCRLSTDVPGLHIINPMLSAGLNDVRLRVENPLQEAWVNGRITLFTASLRRIIPVTLHSLPTVRDLSWRPGPQVLVWEPIAWHSELSAMEEATAPGARPARRSLSPATSIYGLIALALMALGGQLWGLRSLIQFSGDRERWNYAKAQEEAQSSERSRLISEADAELNKGRIAARQAKAESEETKQELARQISALAGINKQLEIARVARAELDDQIGDGRRRLRQELGALRETESKVAELSMQRDRLAGEVENLSKRRDEQEPAIREVDAELQKSRSLLKTVKSQVDDFQAKLGDSQAKLGDTRQAIVESSEELEGILDERAKATADRNAAQVGLVSLKEQAEKARIDRQAALDEVAKLRDTLRQLADQTEAAQNVKGVAETESVRATTELARLKKSIGAKDSELKTIQDRIAESEKRRTAVLAEVEQHRGTLEPLLVQVAQVRAELAAKRLELQGTQKQPDEPPIPGSPPAPAGTVTTAPPQLRAAPAPGVAQPATPRTVTPAPNPATIPRAPSTGDPSGTRPRP